MSQLGDIFEFVTPTEIRSYVDNVSAAFATFAKDAAASNSLSATEIDAWNVLNGNFRKFYQSINFLSLLTVSTLRTAEEFARQLSGWRGIYTSRSGKQPTGIMVTIPDGASIAINTVMRNLAIIAGAGALVYVLSIAKPFIGAAASQLPRRLK